VSVIVQIPPPLRFLTGGLERAQATGRTVAEVVNHLNSAYPGIVDRLYPEGNELNRFVAIFVNGQDIRLLAGDRTTLKDGDVIVILPLVAGGSF
jgi:molybdopterin synthase sulfur carrier subunit